MSRFISFACVALLAVASLHTNAQTGWREIPNQPPCTGRDETALTALDGKLYLVGGRGIDPVEEYDPAAGGWKKLAPPPMEMHHFQALAVDGKIAVAGAMTGKYPHEEPLSHVWWFDPKQNLWTKGAEIPEGRRRGGGGAVLAGGAIYLVCGITHGHWKGFVPWLDRLELETGEWSILPDAPHARDHFNAVLVEGRIVVASGRTSHGEIRKVFELTVPEVDVFDLAKETWTTLSEKLPTPRAGAMNVGRDGKVVVIGGEVATQKEANNEVEMLSLDTGHWEKMAPLCRGRHGTGAAILGDTIHVVSGVGNRGGRPLLNTMETTPWPPAPVSKP